MSLGNDARIARRFTVKFSIRRTLPLDETGVATFAE